MIGEGEVLKSWKDLKSGKDLKSRQRTEEPATVTSSCCPNSINWVRPFLTWVRPEILG